MITPRSHASRLVRALLATIAGLLGVIAALVGGILKRLDGGSLPQAIEFGCGAFAATVLFVFAIYYSSAATGPGTAATDRPPPSLAR
jgi:hypothetical protein